MAIEFNHRETAGSGKGTPRFIAHETDYGHALRDNSTGEVLRSIHRPTSMMSQSPKTDYKKVNADVKEYYGKVKGLENKASQLNAQVKPNRPQKGK